MKLKLVNIIFILAVGVGAIVSGIGSTYNMQWLAFLGIAIMCGGLIVNVMYYRCPHCNNYLGRSRGEFCPYCGGKVNQEK